MKIDWPKKSGVRSLGKYPYKAVKRTHRRHAPPHRIEHIQFSLIQWDGRLGTRKEHFGEGRGQVYPIIGKQPLPSCQEVEVAKTLRRVRNQAFWVSAFNTSSMPPRWQPWVISMSELPPWLEKFDAKIRGRITSRNGGMPDVVAWDDYNPLDSALFVECKGPKKTFGQNQEDWLWAAFAEGLKKSQVAVSVRPF